MDEGELSEDDTLAVLVDKYGAEGLQNSLKFLLAPTHDIRLLALESILEDAYSEVVVDRHLTHSESEDQLTSRIVGMLRMAGLNATHDTQWGGHVDIAVSGRNGFRWMAEAKIDTGNSWLKKGYLQLATRYLPGQRGADTGELIIYGKKRNALKTLKKWASVARQLDECEMQEDNCDDCLHFRTSHVSETSGRRIRIRHRILPIWFNPRD